jgi:adenylate cyclase
MPPPTSDEARDAGAKAMATLRRLLARKAAELIRSDSEAASMALEIGLVDPRWLDNPGRVPVSSAAPIEVIERFWERAVEQRPSRLAALGLGAAQLLASRLSATSEKPVPVTVVFTDLEGFTSYTSEHGDKAALALLHEHHRVALPLVRREGGRVVKTIGDGLLCTFPDAALGLRAAVGLVDSAPAPLKLRAGVHMGEAILSAHDVIGHAVNVAARVADTARGGQALATLEAVQAAGEVPGVVLGRVRSQRLRGIDGRVNVVEVKAVA